MDMEELYDNLCTCTYATYPVFPISILLFNSNLMIYPFINTKISMSVCLSHIQAKSTERIVMKFSDCLKPEKDIGYLLFSN